MSIKITKNTVSFRAESLSSVITEERDPKITDKIFGELKKLSVESTSHGIPKIILAKNLYVKIMWLVFFLISVGICVFMIVRTMSQYLSFGVTTQIARINQAEMKFPAVSICNVNPLVSLAGSEYIKNEYEEMFNLTAVSKYTELSDLIYFNRTINFTSDWFLYKTYHPDFPATLRNSFSYSSKEMLLKCLQTKTKCDLSKLQHYYDPIYGNCYKFNGNSSDDLYKISRQGDGLYMELFTGISDQNLDNSVFYQLPNKGIAIIIDDQDGFPIKKEGILLGPGQYAKMIISKTESETLPSPYGNCQDANLVDTLLSREMAKHGYSYNRQNCMIFCEQKIIIETLGCYDLRLPRIFNATPCFTIESFRAIDKIDFNFDVCFEHCPFECSTTKYDVTISYNDYPTFNYFWDLINQDLDYYADILNVETLDFDLFENSFASLFIYYDELKYTDVIDSPNMLLPDVIANIGGTLGLFVGISLLSFVEIIEIVINFLIIYYKNTKELKNVNA